MDIKILYIFTIVTWTMFFNQSSGTTTNTTECYLSGDNIWTCDHVPQDIPEGVLSVHINGPLSQTYLMEINKTLFQSNSWRAVKYLKFTDGSTYSLIIFREDTFRNLRSLEELQINIDKAISFDPNSLAGLDNVKILDFSKCIRLNFEHLVHRICESDTAPNLEQLIMPGIAYADEPLKLVGDDIRCLSQKPLFHIDLSRTYIGFADLQFLASLHQLQILNVSHSFIGEVHHAGARPEYFQHIKVFDMSYSNLAPISYPIIGTFSNIDLKFIDKGQHLAFVFSPEIVNISGINSAIDLFFDNIRISSVNYFKIWTKQIIATKNSIRRVDVHLMCDNVDFNSIELISLANNGLEYIHPSIFNCIPNLESLDFSQNKLQDMYKENKQLFRQLINAIKNLKTIDLASNQFIDIPNDFFDNNAKLEVINLAENRLTQIHFKLSHLLNLRVLNLAMNSIKLLDQASMNYLVALFETVKSDINNSTNIGTTLDSNLNHDEMKVILKLNPFACDTCKSSDSIHWLLKADLVHGVNENITCTSETGELIHVNKDAATNVQQICDRKIRNTVLTACFVTFSLIFISAAFTIHIRRKRLLQQRKRIEVINELRNDDRRFVVFLSYNSDDELFVRDNVVEPLNEGLQRIIGTDRNLVCRGDEEYRIGRFVYKEALRCIGLSSIFLGVISNNYCNSQYCEEEFDRAIQMSKPVLLMMKEDVDIELMAPAMNVLFRNKVRILWENNNGEYRLKTTWENVCESILDLAGN